MASGPSLHSAAFRGGGVAPGALGAGQVNSPALPFPWRHLPAPWKAPRACRQLIPPAETAAVAAAGTWGIGAERSGLS